MDSGIVYSSEFPPLPSSSPSGSGLRALPLHNGASSSSMRSWKSSLLAQNDKSESITVSFVQDDDEEVHFQEDYVAENQKDWDLCLVGYAIGKRPFYGTLLAAVKKRWRFKGR